MAQNKVIDTPPSYIIATIGFFTTYPIQIQIQIDDLTCTATVRGGQSAPLLRQTCFDLFIFVLWEMVNIATRIICYLNIIIIAEPQQCKITCDESPRHPPNFVM